MSLQTVFDILWHVVVVDGLAVAWRIGLCSILMGAFGLVVLALCFRYGYRAGFLKLEWRHEHLYEKGVLGLWVLTIPLVAVVLGSLIGAWWAGGHIIKSEHVGERIGKTAFKAIVASMAASHLEESENEQVKLAHAFIKGEETITIEQFSKLSTHHAGELSAEKLEQYLPIASGGSVHHGTVWMVEKSLDLIAYAELSDDGDLVYKLVKRVTEHDRTTDNDGLVTVEEVSNIACDTFLDKFARVLWGAVILELLLPVLATFCLLVFLPLALAWVSRKFVIWRATKKHREKHE